MLLDGLGPQYQNFFLPLSIIPQEDKKNQDYFQCYRLLHFSKLFQ